MMRFVPYVLKGLWRHRTRSLLTVSGTAVALFVFCFVNVVQDSLDQMTNDTRSQRTLIVFQENRFCPQSSKLPQDYARHIAKINDVTDVIPIKVFTNNCRASLDAIVFHGLPEEKIRTNRDLSLVDGQWHQFDGQNEAALVGQAVATRRKLKTGEKFSIGNVTVLVAGIFQSDDPEQNNLIYTHLDFLQRARGKNDVGTVTQLEVHLAENADVEAVSTAIDNHYRGGPVATTTRTKGMFQTETLSDLAELIQLIHWLGYACVGLVLALVATTTVMSVQDRIKEHGVLQTVGLRPQQIFQIVVLESTLLSTMGGLLGIGVGFAYLSVSGLSVAAEGVSLTFQPSAQLFVIGTIVSLGVGLTAGIIPGIQAANTKIVNALRHV